MATWILCYHKVGPESEEGRFLNVSPARLRSQVRLLRRLGFSFASGGDADFSRRKQVVLTFDDAYVSTLTHGVEVLKSEAVPATIFAVPHFVGELSIWDDVEKARPLADLQLLQAASKSGFEIANHTMSHADLSSLSLDEQVKQWQAASEALTNWGLIGNIGCFPYGRMNGDSVAALARAKIVRCFGLRKMAANVNSPLLDLPRIPISFGDAEVLLLYKMFVRPRLP